MLLCFQSGMGWAGINALISEAASPHLLGRLALGKSSTFYLHPCLFSYIGKMEMKVPPSKVAVRIKLVKIDEALGGVLGS